MPVKSGLRSYGGLQHIGTTKYKQLQSNVIVAAIVIV